MMSALKKSKKVRSLKKSFNNALLDNWHYFLLKTFAELKKKILDEGISQDELAARLGKNKGFVSRTLTGQNNITLKTMYMFARAMNHRMEIVLVDLNSVQRINREYIEHKTLQPVKPSATRTSRSYTFISHGADITALGNVGELTVGANS